ncbi:MAG: GDYXXLXY domain-containing protein [Nocardioides sp.]|uniref:GDYXXLXY domain-containing protein n=1 Tax=Nocardioides sp. TaxID=35761 RepID=UPI003F000044
MKRVLPLVALVVGQLALVGVAVAPQLSARTTGDTYTFRVAPLDPVDPFRGRYVQLTYPDLQVGNTEEWETGTPIGIDDDGRSGTVYLRLIDNDGVWGVDGVSRTKPESDDFLKCSSDGWEIRCGIETLFVNEARAPRMERELADGAYAEVRIDRYGNASVVDVRE